MRWSSRGFKKIGDIETGIPYLTLGRLAILMIPLLINFLQSDNIKNLKKFLIDGDTTALLEFLKGYNHRNFGCNYRWFCNYKNSENFFRYR